MNKIARKHGYYIDAIGIKKYNKAYINIGPQGNTDCEEKKLVISIDNSLIKLEEKDKTIKILNVTEVLKESSYNEWDYLNIVVNIFIDKIANKINLDKSFIYFFDDITRVDYDDARFSDEIDI